MLEPPFFGNLVYLGYVPFLSITFGLGTVPPLPPGIDVFEVQLQAVFKVGSPAFNLGPPDHLVLLDAAY